MFSQLAEEYSDSTYADVAEEIYNKTWISNYEKKDKIVTSVTALSKFNIIPENFQLEFIKNYASLKFAHDLDGYILSFEQGLGKTFTAVALAECLKKEIIYIICPNSTKDNWANEIKTYYKKYNNDNGLFKEEVFVSGNINYVFNKKTTKFIIINQESISNIFKFVQPEKDSMIIVDESHNFRGLNTKRVTAMLELKNISNCKDCLLMSGTPLKATAGELTPALLMVDPHFTPELAELYYKTFSTSSTEAASIVKARFKRVIYRKLKKDTLKLPEKFISNILYKIPHEEDYGLNKIKEKIIQEFHIEYMKRLESGLFTNNKKSIFYRKTSEGYNFYDARQKFESVVRKYSRAHSSNTTEYLNRIFQESEDKHYELITAMNAESKYFDFLKKYVIPFVETKEEKEILTTNINGIYGWFIAAKGASSSVMGRLIAEYKNKCFINIWKYNYKDFIEKIQTARKKTIIFTALVPTADYISEDLTKRGIKNVKITGSGAGRTSLLNNFKTDDSIEVLVATTQTMAEGVTLTEANQILFFGTPYRSTDFEQATDRIHRIGQSENCYIYNVLLWSREKNITGRIEEILNWSEEMFDALINESADIEF